MNAAGPSDYTIDGIEIGFAGPGCAGAVGGWAGASYGSATGVLTIVGQATVVTFVDPVSNCLGLVNVGEVVPVLSDSYDVAVM